MPSLFIEFFIFLLVFHSYSFPVCHTLLSVFGLAFLVYTFSCLSFCSSKQFCGDLFLSKLVCCDIVLFEAPPFHKKGLVEDKILSWSGLSTFLGIFFSSNLYLTVFV